MLARHGLTELTADGERNPRRERCGMPPAGAFAARFVEVRVDADLGLLRVARIVSAVDAGRILNEKLARSQIIGGTVDGHRHGAARGDRLRPRTGRIANATFGDYLIPANADVARDRRDLRGRARPVRPLGIKGLGEIGVVGISAAIANAVYHATGRRIRSLPITVEQLL